MRSTPVRWSDDLAIYAVSAVFFACVWGEKKGVAVQVRGAPPKFEAVWAGHNADVFIGRRNSYFRVMTCRGTCSIGAEPGGCDGASIKLHYGMKLRRAGISGRVSVRK